MNTAYKLGGGYHAVFEGNSPQMKVVYRNPKTQPEVHITDEDYEYIVGKVLEKCYQESVTIAAFIKIEKRQRNVDQQRPISHHRLRRVEPAHPCGTDRPHVQPASDLRGRRFPAAHHRNRRFDGRLPPCDTAQVE